PAQFPPPQVGWMRLVEQEWVLGARASTRKHWPPLPAISPPTRLQHRTRMTFGRQVRAVWAAADGGCEYPAGVGFFGARARPDSAHQESTTSHSPLSSQTENAASSVSSNSSNPRRSLSRRRVWVPTMPSGSS